MKIEVDGNNQPLTRFVLHELLHVTFSELILGKFDRTLEEVMILAYEEYMWNFIQASKTRRAKWEALIERKLAEFRATQPDIPLVELADRTGEG